MIVHESSNVYDDLTAWQNLMFTAELYTVGNRSVRIGEENFLTSSACGKDEMIKSVVF